MVGVELVKFGKGCGISLTHFSAGNNSVLVLIYEVRMQFLKIISGGA